MGNQNAKGLTRLINATKYSMQGFKSAFEHEEAFRQESILAMILVPLGLVLGDTGLSKALMVSSVLLVIIVELFNTGIEFVVDRIGEDLHAYSGIAKDVGSAAVFISLINVIVVWALVLFF